MKFLAILGDSLRESIDAKVFYVMLGLSTLLVALALSCTFRPQPGGQLLMNVATMGLTIDTKGLDFSQDSDPKEVIGQMMGRFQGGVWHIGEVAPVGSQPDLPTSTFKLKLNAQFNPLWGKIPANPEEFIREHFGHLDTWQLVDVTSIRRIDTPGIGGFRNPFTAAFEVEAKVLPAGRRLWPHSFSLLFGLLPLPIFNQGVPLGMMLYGLEDYIVNGFGAWVAILVSIVITAFFVPNMLRKGTIDLLVSKPISRPTLLLYKYVGGLLFILINTTFAVGGVWLALSFRSGIWAPSFLVSILTITFFFAILYSVSVFFGVLTRSPVATILLTCLVWLGLFLVSMVNKAILDLRHDEYTQRLRKCSPILVGMVGVEASLDGQGPLLAATLLSVPRRELNTGGPFRSPPPRRPGKDMPDLPDDSSAFTEDTHPLTRPVEYQNWFTSCVSGLHYVLPRTHDLNDLTTSLLVSDLIFSNSMSTKKLMPKPITWTESLTVSGLFMALMLGLACWRFVRRDY